jgi:hypothetical protein
VATVREKRTITLLTDLPVWVEPLADALRQRGARVLVTTEASEANDDSLLVNRISARLARRNPQKARELLGALQDQETRGRVIVNGPTCLRLGHDKLAQANLFHEAGTRTPETQPAVPGERALPGLPVLLKPPAGGYGKGIRRLGPEESAPEDLFGRTDGWVEQAFHQAADNAVHRVEFLGQRILYDARFPLKATTFDYCLACGSQEIHLLRESEMDPVIIEAAKRIARLGGLELGSIEYLLAKDGEPVFIDFNPVSSLHPDATEILREDPLEQTAAYLIQRASGAVHKASPV